MAAVETFSTIEHPYFNHSYIEVDNDGNMGLHFRRFCIRADWHIRNEIAG